MSIRSLVFASLSDMFASCDGRATDRRRLICQNRVRLKCARTKGSSQTPPCDQYIFLQGMSLMPMKIRIAKKTSKFSSVTSFHPSKIARVNSFGQQQVAVTVCVHLHQSTNRLPKQIEDCQRITKISVSWKPGTTFWSKRAFWHLQLVPCPRGGVGSSTVKSALSPSMLSTIPDHVMPILE